MTGILAKCSLGVSNNNSRKKDKKKLNACLISQYKLSLYDAWKGNNFIHHVQFDIRTKTNNNKIAIIN